MEIDKLSHPQSASLISQLFLDHYRLKGYKVLPSSSLLDPSVPMSFVMSAGLVQVERSAAQQGGRDHDRYVLLQNCFRYFDLDTVGESNYHLTLFQMAGAFVFGGVDRLACFSNIWELLVNVFCLPRENLWVTYFGGGKLGGHFFEPDQETYQTWRLLGFPPERIVALGVDDNFWKQGNSVVGEKEAPKCGPNTEVFYDHGKQFRCGPDCKPGCRCGRFVEIQNNLLITWHLDEKRGVLKPLDEPFVESVIGVERLEMLLKRKKTIFETNKISQVVDFIRKFEPDIDDPFVDKTKQERILADHLISILFLTADEAPPPGHGGRRRLMRKLVRGVLTAIRLLEISDVQFLPALLDYVAEVYVNRHKDLRHARDVALLYILREEQIFAETLSKGRDKFDYLVETKEGVLSAHDIVNLEKKDGIPKPLLMFLLRQTQVAFNQKAYENAYAAWYQDITG